MSTLQEDVSGSLKTIVAEKLKTLQNFNEDVNYVAEYIVLLLSNGGTHDSVLQELIGLFDSVSQEALAGVVQTSFQALELLRSGDNAETVYRKLAGVIEPVSAAESGSMSMSMSAPSEPTASTAATSVPKSAFEGMVDLSGSKYAGKGVSGMSRGSGGSSIGSGNGFKHRTPGGRQGGVGKFQNGARRGESQHHVTRHKTNALARALGFNDNDAGTTTVSSSVNIIPRKEGRCKLFPRCPLGKFCPHAHPTKVCRDYPNCTNAPGTCEFLHPNEDVELMKDMEKTREEFREKRIALAQSRTKPVHTGIVLCKFGILCSNPMCPFGHPTPANEDSKVIQFVWCPQNLTCDKKDCDKAHSSLSKIREVQPMVASTRPKAAASIEKSLEQCKFGMKCTNKRCKYRHARSHVMCREGALCTRIDCFFGHPVNEACKFAAECKNQYCLFQHPEGRTLPEKAGTAGDAPAGPWPAPLLPVGNQSTNERPYAIAESSGIEPAPVQESDGDATMA
ncbi:mRNA-binding protein NAB2 Ecym_3055 [Eremothecium cymbalariae DBVPG|uniref:C3H1-type domain-containing protein n=1 Tax=Eremothecium cymbalariae (strain CBS 270.75 / DBVPG 7215 / KCTC 17166 / NRRL Y-17582) TaxID=931890 RepID=G8JQZ8_ERECY|nr:Hypothetical protein Ecym_3055 [Eremothecium cymbalariae DBVPG\